jgi:hypothetical protein
MIDYDLRQQGDVFLANPDHCLNAEKRLYLYDVALIDSDGDGLIHHFRFYIDASPAEYGVLRVMYAEESPR